MEKSLNTRIQNLCYGIKGTLKNRLICEVESPISDSHLHLVPTGETCSYSPQDNLYALFLADSTMRIQQQIALHSPALLTIEMQTREVDNIATSRYENDSLLLYSKRWTFVHIDAVADPGLRWGAKVQNF